jgi:hypothetical protein
MTAFMTASVCVGLVLLVRDCLRDDDWSRLPYFEGHDFWSLMLLPPVLAVQAFCYPYWLVVRLLWRRYVAKYGPPADPPMRDLRGTRKET